MWWSTYWAIICFWCGITVFKNWCYFNFLKYFWKSATSYTVLYFLNRFLEHWIWDAIWNSSFISRKFLNQILKTSFLETVSKEKFSLPKFSFTFLQLFSFSKFIFPFDSRRFKTLVVFVKYWVKVLEFFLFSLSDSFFSVKIMLLLVLHLSEKKG